MARSTRDGPTLLAQRVATAAVGIPAIVALIWVGGWPYAIVAAAALAVAAAEFAHLRYPWQRTWAAALPVALVVVSVHAWESSWFWLLLVIGEALYWAYKLLQIRNREADWEELWAPAVIPYVGLCGTTFVLLRDLSDGRDWVYLALFSTFAVDTAAYFTGRAVGRRKMAPVISPNKTWEGFAGGYAGGFAGVLLLNYVLGLRVDAASAVLIAATLPAAAATGDLLESWLKRRAGVKDASDLIPGHGGVLDRLDSLLFTFPVVYVVARWIA